VNAYEIKARMVFIAGKTVWSMPEHIRVVCIPCKALYKCSAFTFTVRFHSHSVTCKVICVIFVLK